MTLGVAPAWQNAAALLPVAWEKASENVGKSVGLRYQTIRLDSTTNTSIDKAVDLWLLDFLTRVDGLGHVPDATSAELYRRAARRLAAGKRSILRLKCRGHGGVDAVPVRPSRAEHRFQRGLSGDYRRPLRQPLEAFGRGDDS